MNLDTRLAPERDHPAPAPDGGAPGRIPMAPADPFALVGLVGASRPMQRVRADVLRYARSSAPVLITGETGTGKELVARALHLASPRARGPLVSVNVATLRTELVTSELFGHERGAFTGAFTRRRGLFEQAHGGTLFLDELGELDARTQADLLRVLETGEVRPLGCERPRTVDVRVIAATHRDLATMVRAGCFRADLYYRLNVLTVTLPALRERRADVPVLVEHLLARLRPEVGDRRLATDALALLGRHPFPGNIRQLLNVLRRAMVRDERVVLDAAALADALAAEPGTLGPVPYQTPARDLSVPAVAEAMQASGGSISAAARRLGIARSTLRGRLHASHRGDVCQAQSSLTRSAINPLLRTEEP
ncbi:MAG: sigma-54-dependent Fis family transcriptional regulator [Myxococcaceae bacterium]|nr:MAG: sigma-54-dependent Fis family transcriptional regulator [Myxococcaceae bacterium]